jgi:hypothetical protein
VKFFFQLRAIFDDPTVNGSVIEFNPSLFYEFFDVTRAQVLKG